MRIAAVVLVASCSFEAGTFRQTMDDASTDATVVVAEDASIDTVPIDAPCADDDNDAVCNAVDTWPCGVEPAPPPPAFMLERNSGQTQLDVSTVSYAGQGQLAVVNAGSTANVTLAYEFKDTACPGSCRDQIEVGWTPGGRVGCAFDATVSSSSGASGNAMRAMTAPATPGVYTIRVNIGQNSSCGTTTNYWALETASQAEVATVCVQ